MHRSLALIVTARRLMRPLSFALACVASLTLVSLSSAGTNDKVTICHFPPGNPANYQTITIGAAALSAHLAHGDFPGSCANDCRLFGSVCDDENLCTTDTCNPDGTCAHSAPRDCDDGIVCTADSCDPAIGNCVNTPVTGLVYCDDGNDCTSPDTCTNAGTCQGTPITGCCNTAAECDDGNLCTSDGCANRTCSNTPVTCTAPDLCTVATCNPLDGTCENAPKSCDDGLSCTADSCNPADGSCQHTQVCCSYSTSGIRTACDYYRGSATCQACLQAQCPLAVTACNDAVQYNCGCGSGCAYGNPGCAAQINDCTQCASACCPG